MCYNPECERKLCCCGPVSLCKQSDVRCWLNVSVVFVVWRQQQLLSRCAAGRVQSDLCLHVYSETCMYVPTTTPRRAERQNW